MKYLLKSIKYFFLFTIVFMLFVVILVLTSKDATFANVFSQDSVLFQANSLPKILILFVALAAIYPALGWIKKEVFIGGTFDEDRDKIIAAFENAGYVLANDDADKMTFRAKSGFTRFARLYEDAVTITKDENPLILQGYRRDIFRLASAIEYATRREEEEESNN